MARRSDHTREELKEMAIGIAEKMVVNEGMSGVSARKIANEMGYTVGTIYLIFKNLDEIITEVNLRTLKQLESEIEKKISRQSSPQEKIATIAKCYLEYAQSNSKRWRTVFDHQLAGDEKFPDHYHRQVAGLFSIIEKPLREIHNGKANGEIIREARALWASLHGLAMLTLGEKLNPADAAPEDILDLILRRIIGFDSKGGNV